MFKSKFAKQLAAALSNAVGIAQPCAAPTHVQDLVPFGTWEQQVGKVQVPCAALSVGTGGLTPLYVVARYRRRLYWLQVVPTCSLN